MRPIHLLLSLPMMLPIALPAGLTLGLALAVRALRYRSRPVNLTNSTSPP